MESREVDQGVVFVAGEALIDLVAEPDGRFRPFPGGSPANVAVGLARLGTPTQLLARLSDGVFGKLLRDHLRTSGVGLDLAVSADEPTTLAVVSLDTAGGASYEFYADGTADWAWRSDELAALPSSATALVSGSIALFRGPGGSALRTMIRREHDRGAVCVLLDPNLRPNLLGPVETVRAHWDELINLADVVKVSDEDLRWLAPEASPDTVAADWLDRGPAMVVVTLGGDGAFGLTPDGVRVDVNPPPVDVVDTIGAGDAFTAGLVDSMRRAELLNRPGDAGDRGDTAWARLATLPADSLRALLDRASLAAAITCGRAGADPPTETDLRNG